MGQVFKVTTNSRDVERKLQDIAEKQIPYALKEGVNSFAKDAIKREQKETRRVFDRPTKFVLYGLRVTKWATKQDPSAELGFKDVYGRHGEAIENALKPHVPGYPNTRAPKGMERQLRRVGFLGANEWLVPSRTCPLDANGNIRGSLASKMLADSGEYRGISGFEGTTKAAKARYVLGEVHGRNGRPVKGIWLVRGGASKTATGRWRLMMIVVTKRPTTPSGSTSMAWHKSTPRNTWESMSLRASTKPSGQQGEEISLQIQFSFPGKYDALRPWPCSCATGNWHLGSSANFGGWRSRHQVTGWLL